MLGCTVERRLEAIGLIQLRAGRSLIDLVPVDGELGRAGGAPPGSEGRNLDHFCLRVEPFDEPAIRRHLEAHDVEAGPLATRYGAEGEGPSLYITDPEGNVVELKGPPDAKDLGAGRPPARPARARRACRRRHPPRPDAPHGGDRMGPQDATVQAGAVALRPDLRTPVRSVARWQAPDLLRHERPLAVRRQGLLDRHLACALPKATSLFAKGNCWNGGGLFQSPTRYWLNDGCGHEVREEDRRLQRVDAYPWHESYGGECPSVYYIRLQRDGWKMKYTAPDGEGGQVSLFEKRVDNHWILRKHAHATLFRPPGRGVYFDTHELFNTRSEEVLMKHDWEWAEVDGGRLVWAAGGCLHAGRIDAKGLHDEKMLHDFRPMRSKGSWRPTERTRGRTAPC